MAGYKYVIIEQQVDGVPGTGAEIEVWDQSSVFTQKHGREKFREVYKVVRGMYSLIVSVQDGTIDPDKELVSIMAMTSGGGYFARLTRRWNCPWWKAWCGYFKLALNQENHLPHACFPAEYTTMYKWNPVLHKLEPAVEQVQAYKVILSFQSK